MKRARPVTLAALTTIAWLVANSSALNVRLNGVHYTARKAAASIDIPADQQCKSAMEIRKDFELLQNLTWRVRIDSLSDCNQSRPVLEAAKRAGLQVALGIATSSSRDQFVREKDQLNQLIRDRLMDEKLVTSVFVGSESVHRGEISAKQAIDYMREIRALLRRRQFATLVTVGETVDTYLAYPHLVNVVDFVAVYQYSFWEGIAVENAVQHMTERLQPMLRLATRKRKRVVIGATGWASQGEAKQTASATGANQAAFLKGFMAMAEAKQLEYFWYSALDAPWTGDNFSVESHFGLLTSTGRLKDQLTGFSI